MSHESCASKILRITRSGKSSTENPQNPILNFYMIIFYLNIVPFQQETDIGIKLLTTDLSKIHQLLQALRRVCVCPCAM